MCLAVTLPKLAHGHAGPGPLPLLGWVAACACFQLPPRRHLTGGGTQHLRMAAQGRLVGGGLPPSAHAVFQDVGLPARRRDAEPEPGDVRIPNDVARVLGAGALNEGLGDPFSPRGLGHPSPNIQKPHPWRGSMRIDSLLPIQTKSEVTRLRCAEVTIYFKELGV